MRELGIVHSVRLRKTRREVGGHDESRPQMHVHLQLTNNSEIALSDPAGPLWVPLFLVFRRS